MGCRATRYSNFVSLLRGLMGSRMVYLERVYVHIDSFMSGAHLILRICDLHTFPICDLVLNC